MLDLVFIAIGVLFLVGSYGVIEVCARLREGNV
jgi:hypothetical protein